MRNALVGLWLGCMLAGCGATPKVVTVQGASPKAKNENAVPVAAQPAQETPKTQQASPEREPAVKAANGPWIGAAGASDFVLAGTQDTHLGVWVDVPASLRRAHVPTAVALVVDTSGSMGGEKIQHARAAARTLIDKLSDGDLVTIATFADNAIERVPPTLLSSSTRPIVIRTIDQMEPAGSTNMFDGLRLGEGRATTAPATHAVRRVVLISDGQANVGPSSPEVLGALAQRGADRGVQVTALGVGADYDERTLNALAVASSGRLYHLSEPQEMASILESELRLLEGTAATDAFVEIVPAPGVQLLGVEGVRSTWSSGSLRVPLGTMFGGQHREMLVRVRLTAPAQGQHALASVRLHFRDPVEGNLERVQEVVARYQVTGDSTMIAKSTNARTQTIAAVMDAGKAQVDAAQDVNTGNFEAAEAKLAAAEAKLRDTAARAAAPEEKQRAMAAATAMAQVRTKARASAAKPKPAQRMDALDINASGMKSMGF